MSLSTLGVECVPYSLLRLMVSVPGSLKRKAYTTQVRGCLAHWKRDRSIWSLHAPRDQYCATTSARVASAHCGVLKVPDWGGRGEGGDFLLLAWRTYIQ